MSWAAWLCLTSQTGDSTEEETVVTTPGTSNERLPFLEEDPVCAANEAASALSWSLRSAMAEVSSKGIEMCRSIKCLYNGENVCVYVYIYICASYYLVNAK